MPLFAIPFPVMNPVAFAIGPVEVHWYGLAYMCGLLLGWLYARSLLSNQALWAGKSPAGPEIADDFGARFRSAISQLASGITEDLPLEAMRQKVWDLYTNDLQPSASDLKSALDGHNVGWFSTAMLKTSFLSAGPTSLLATAGLAVPHALLVGAGISLVASGILYNIERRKKLRDNPYSYLLRAERQFGN